MALYFIIPFVKIPSVEYSETCMNPSGLQLFDS